MKKVLLDKRLAELQFEQDQLLAELSHTDELMRKVGFVGGIQAMKRAAEEVVDLDLGGEI